MTQPVYNIIICNHEPTAIQELAIASSILIPVFEDLAHDLGDYYVGKWVIERKRTQDFMSSLIDGRLFDQARKMAQLPSEYKKAFLIEGKFQYKLLKMHHLTQDQINGAINALLRDYGIATFLTSSKAKTITELEKLVNNEVNPFDILTVVRHKGIGKMNNNQKSEFIIQGIEGLGQVKAIALLTENKTLRKTLEVLLDHGVIEREAFGNAPLQSQIIKGKILEKWDELLNHQYGSD